MSPPEGNAGGDMGIGAFVPILRSFDEGQTRDFCLRYLGFEVAFEHRFGPGMPLYMGVTPGGPSGKHELHLSEHHGDATPGSALRIEMADADAFHREIAARGHPRADPGLRDQEWEWREVSVRDPSGNRLIFCSRLKGA